MSSLEGSRPAEADAQEDARSNAVADAKAAASLKLRDKIDAWRKRHHLLETVAFFMGGFCFDLLLLERIDSHPMLIHQGSYLVLLTGLLAVDHHYTVIGHEGQGFFAKFLHYRHELIHFLFGTLLNAFLVFYFKSSSGVFAFLFLLLLLAVLLANELPRFRKLGPLMRVGLLSFALTSYFSYLFPVLAGFLSPWLFVSAVALASLLTWLLWLAYARWTHDPAWTFKRAVAPALAIQATLLLLYFLHVVPPVPLSIKWMGVYHGAHLEGDGAKVLQQKPGWRFWRHGDQEFLARKGDRIYCFVRIFAPTHFRDALRIRWSHDDPKLGWVHADTVPLSVVGGREEGFRAIAYKQHWTPGDWRVSVETSDGREIGNLGLTVVEDDTTGPRELEESTR